MRDVDLVFHFDTRGHLYYTFGVYIKIEKIPGINFSDFDSNYRSDRIGFVDSKVVHYSLLTLLSTKKCDL